MRPLAWELPGSEESHGTGRTTLCPPPGHWGGGKWQQGSEEHRSLVGGAGLGCFQGWEGRAGAGEGQESPLPGCLQLHHDTSGLLELPNPHCAVQFADCARNKSERHSLKLPPPASSA